VRRFHLLFPYLLLGVLASAIAYTNMDASDDHPTHLVNHSAVCQTCGMTVNTDTALRSNKNGTTRYYCSESCRARARENIETGPKANGRIVDVVCHMEVNRSWGFQADYKDKRYYFCTTQCRDKFVASPSKYLTVSCMVCGRPLAGKQTFSATYLGHTYHLCSESHRSIFKKDPAAYFMHSMWGIPTWLYYVSIAIVLLVSFGVFDWLSRKTSTTAEVIEAQPKKSLHIPATEIRGEGERLAPSGVMSGSPSAAISLRLPVLSTTTMHVGSVRAKSNDRFDLLSLSWIKAAAKSRIFRFCCQSFVVGLFILTIAAGLFGNQNPALNIAPILTWTIWWALLIVLIMYAGKAWCYVCPWDAIAGWVEKLSIWKKSEDGLSLRLKWPRVVRNIAIATIMFVGLTWIELGFGVTMKPRVTAYLAIGMLLMTVVSALLFDRKSFCRYGCLVGRVSGLYALFAGVEVRSKESGVCKSCHTKECVTGSEKAYGCPTFLYPGKIESNTYCIQCMECVQACPHDNLSLNLRPWGSDLASEGKPRADEAYLALLMLTLAAFHGITMTPIWQQLVDAIRASVDVGRILGFSLGMVLLIVGPIAIYAALVGISKSLGNAHAIKSFTYRDYFIRYAYAMLPIALFYHIAHNLEHLLMEGPKVIAIMSDPFGWHWNLFGTAGWVIPPMIALDKLWIVQVFLVLVGHVYSLWIAQKTSLRLFGTSKSAFRSQLPMLAGMIAFSVFSLWLLKQPMEMRMSAM